MRLRCHLKYSIARNLTKSVSTDTFAVDLHLNLSLPPTSTCNASSGGLGNYESHQTPHNHPQQNIQHMSGGMSPANAQPVQLFPTCSINNNIGNVVSFSFKRFNE